MAMSWITVSREQVRRSFRPRSPESHKGTYGHVLSLCGHDGMAGAALLSGEAVLRSGAGLLTLALPRSLYPMVTTALPEALCLPLPETETGGVSQEAYPLLKQARERANVLLCGCGLGTEKPTEALLTALLAEQTVPVILDADGINLSVSHIDTLKAVSQLCLTPHAGEAARLLGCTPAEVQAHREAAATCLAEQTGAVVVLKGHRTLITAPQQPIFVNSTGNAGMATGGSGDVLAGMIASFAAQGMPLMEAAVCGAYLHGCAGDLAAKRLSQHAMLPSDMLRCLGELFVSFE